MEKVILIVHGMRKGELNQKLIQFVDQLFEGDKLDYDIALSLIHISEPTRPY